MVPAHNLDSLDDLGVDARQLGQLEAAFRQGLRPSSRHLHVWRVGPGSEAGSCLRLIDSCIAQLKAQGPSRICNESKEEEERRTWAKGVLGVKSNTPILVTYRRALILLVGIRLCINFHDLIVLVQICAHLDPEPFERAERMLSVETRLRV